MKYICLGNLTIIGSDNGLSPDRRQAIVWTNAGILVIGPLGTNFNGMLNEIYTFSFRPILVSKDWLGCLKDPYCGRYLNLCHNILKMKLSVRKSIVTTDRLFCAFHDNNVLCMFCGKACDLITDRLLPCLASFSLMFSYSISDLVYYWFM